MEQATFSRLRDKFVYLIAGIVIALDQGSKYLIQASLNPGGSLFYLGPLEITYVQNTGSAFGLFPNQTLFLILASFIGIGILILFYRQQSFRTTLITVSLGLQLGGAIGNLADRIRLGYVVDFIYVELWPGYHWPAFNVADSSIVVGIVILAALMLLERRRPEPVSAPRPEGGEDLLISALEPPAEKEDTPPPPFVRTSMRPEERISENGNARNHR